MTPDSTPPDTTTAPPRIRSFRHEPTGRRMFRLSVHLLYTLAFLGLIGILAFLSQPLWPWLAVLWPEAERLMGEWGKALHFDT